MTTSGGLGCAFARRRSALIALVAVAQLVALWLASSAVAAAPVIESESVANLTPTDGILEATINPGGLETTYEFEMWESPCGPECEVIVPIPLPSATLPAGSGGQDVSLDLNGAGVTLTPGGQYGYRVVASNSDGPANGQWHEFEAPEEGSPKVIGERVSKVSSSDATLEATIDVGNAPDGLHYQFQLVENSSELAEEIQCPASSSVPLCLRAQSQTALPIGDVAPGAGEQTVSLDLNSAGVTLKHGTTYHYRVLIAPAKLSEDTIEWEEPTLFGRNQTFVASPKPVIESESVSNVTATDATLEAVINPEGAATTYEFTLVKRFACEELSPPCLPPNESIPVPGGEIAASSEGQHVSVDLNSVGITLNPGSLYGYSVHATNVGGTGFGWQQSFMTLGPPSPPTPSESNDGSGTPPPPPGLPFGSGHRHHHHRHHHHHHHRGSLVSGLHSSRPAG